jgi:glycosyltransferase involved in cell wall biosynthesis
MKVALLSTFGPEVRGISYYSDCLLRALNAVDAIQVMPVDYAKIYPDWLHPAQKSPPKQNNLRVLHYARPWTWSLKRYQPDLIHLQAWTFATALMHRRVLGEAKRLGIPTVLTLHNPAAHEMAGLPAWLQNSCLRLADALVIHDACGLTAIPSQWRPKVHVIHHGTESLVLSDRDLQAADHTSPYLLYFGNIRPYKGVDLLLAAWQDLAAEYPQFRLIVAGQLWQGETLLSRVVARLLGTEKHGRIIRQLLDDPGLLNVESRLGFIADDELDRLIRQARYAIFPYRRFSGHSGAVSRAAAQGVPVLVSDVGGLASLATGRENVFQAGNQESLRALLRRKLELPGSNLPERRLQLRRAQDMSWNHAASLHASLYEELLRAARKK